MLIPLILNGGGGQRLWPLSTKSHPKAFLKIASPYSLLQQTALRAQKLKNVEKLWLCCNQEHEHLSAEHLSQINIPNFGILSEPVGRNTAPAIAISALYLQHLYEDPTILVLPADHIYEREDVFLSAVEKGLELLNQKESIVLFGVQPNKAHTGYGYIEASDQGKVLSFREKPEAQLAESYLKSGDFYWNSGVFLFKASFFLKELEHHNPEVYQSALEALEDKQAQEGVVRISKSYASCQNISIDYALIEKSKNLNLVPLVDSGWSDVGSWDSCYELEGKDQDANASIGNNHLLNTKSSYVRSERKPIGVIGLKDIIAIESPSAVLVANRNSAEQVKDLLKQFEQEGPFNLEAKCMRPWGSFEVILKEKNYQVKRLCLKPGAQISYQFHRHRYEHWIVVKGTAEAQREESKVVLKENDSFFVPIGARHRLKNIGDSELSVIEIQYGTKVEEEDIVRLEDVYKRDVAA